VVSTIPGWEPDGIKEEKEFLFSSIKSENRRAEQVLQGVEVGGWGNWLVPLEVGKGQRKGVGG
jgi:hypothetical protein